MASILCAKNEPEDLGIMKKYDEIKNGIRNSSTWRLDLHMQLYLLSFLNFYIWHYIIDNLFIYFVNKIHRCSLNQRAFNVVFCTDHCICGLKCTFIVKLLKAMPNKHQQPNDFN